MRVEDFYNQACPTKNKLQSLVHDKTRPLVLRKAVVRMCDCCKKGTEAEGILLELGRLLKEEYEPSWFDFDWQFEQQIADDMSCFKRFLVWLNGARCVEANIRVEAGQFSSRADMIVERSDGELVAMIIHPKKADKSPGGKSTHTSTKKDLYALVTKAGLEKRYPKIQTALVYLFNEDDNAGKIGKFLSTSTRKSNVFFERWTSLYEDGIFDGRYVTKLIAQIALERPVPDCYSCSQKGLCAKDSVSKVSHAKPAIVQEVDTYKMPKFTKAQQEVVTFRDGPMLVCAGPGSGKTATLVGRIKQLIDNGVPPEFILGITFTRDAAGELLRRCQSFCKDDEHPEILTLNALGYKLLRDNDELVGQKVKLLSSLDRLRLIENLLSDTPMMSGFSYAVKTGKKGLLATLDRRITEYGNDPDAYRQKHPEMDETFVRFVEAFNGAVKAQGYINFDEQISLALKMLDEHPEAAAALSRRYAYIMVDEYQDVNEEQVRLVYALAKHKNLVVVGDDDQSIYGFRGGSNEYMLSFGRDFPDAKRVVLTENFRSTGALVEKAQTFIESNRHRISKEVQPVRKRGYEPMILSGKTGATLNSCVEDLINKGFEYKDIAVLASKNATLEELIREVSFNSVLGKAYLRENPVFRIMLNILSLHYEGITEGTLLTVLMLMDVMPDKPIGEVLAAYPDLKAGRYDKKVREPLYKALCLIHTCLDRVDECSAVYFLDLVSQTLGVEDTAIEQALSDIIEKNHLRDCDALYAHLKNMSDFEDDTKIEPDTSDAVLFITSHESKGMEWRAVIMVDDYKDDRSEETNRLYYVAMTRAKDMLCIMTDGGSTLLTKGGQAA